MNQVVTPQGAIHYEEKGEGPAVIFLHAALADHRQWSVQADALSHDCRCITYDLAGYGASDPALDRNDPAETLLALMDHLELPTAALVGSSLGGSIALHTALQYPERIRSIMVFGTGLFGFQPKLNTPEPATYREYEAALMAHDVERIVELAEVIWLTGVSGHKEDVPEASRELFRIMYRDLLLFHSGESFDQEGLDDTQGIANLSLPALIVIGEHDAAFCGAVADYLEHTLPHSKIVRMLKAAHFPNLSKPKAVTELIAQWNSDPGSVEPPNPCG